MTAEHRAKESPSSAAKIWRSGGADEGRHQKQLSEYAKHKKRTLTKVCRLILAKYPRLCKLLPRLESCGNFLNYLHFFEKDIWRLKSGFTCQLHFLCGCCARRRSVRFSYRYAEKALRLKKENPNLKFYFVTLTMKNGEDLAVLTDRLSDAKKKMLVHRRQALAASTTARGKILDTIFQFMEGGVGTYEFKRGKNSGLWHPHIHMLVCSEREFDLTPVEEPEYGINPETGKFGIIGSKIVYKALELQHGVSKEWVELTGDSFITDARWVDDTDEDELYRVLFEVFGYTLKMNDLSPEDQLYAYDVLSQKGRSRRLIFSFGNFRGVSHAEPESDEIEDDLKGEKYFDIWYKHRRDIHDYEVDLELSNFTPKVFGESDCFIPGKRKIVRISNCFIKDDVEDWVEQYKQKDDPPF